MPQYYWAATLLLYWQYPYVTVLQQYCHCIAFLYNALKTYTVASYLRACHVITMKHKNQFENKLLYSTSLKLRIKIAFLDFNYYIAFKLMVMKKLNSSTEDTVH